MRLSKGSGPIGLAGMDKISLLHHHAPSFKQSASIYLVRPLLSISRSDIEQIAQKHHIPFVQDPSNDSLKYERIQWRFKKKNLDHLGLKRQASANVMAKMRDCRHMIEYFVDQFFHDSIVCSQEYWTVDRKELIKLPIFLQIVIIQRILQQKTNRVHPTNYTTTRLLCKKFQKLTDHKKTTLGGCLFILNPQFIVIRLENRPQKTLVSND
jgi:tRNA(Ile)-lysidine synthase